MPLLKTLIFTVLVPGTVVVLVPRWLLGGRAALHLDAFGLLGLLLLLAGAATYLRCAWEFATVGRGTPAIVDPPKELVVTGLYRYVRNPMYVGVLALLFGEAALFRSVPLLRYALIVFLFFHLFVVLYEEPVLRAKFGASHERYCAAVPRWLPRRQPWTG